MNDSETTANALAGAKIALGITGGIAAYKAPLLIRLLKKAGADVRVLATRNALQFTTRWTLETLAENPLESDLFPEERGGGTHHIDTASWADLFVIAPATANLLGKVASGISDDVLTATLCAYSGPVMIAPAMNTNMFLNPVTKRNLEFLRSIGYQVIDPDEGEMACHTVGIGRMAEPERIFAEIQQALSSSSPKPAKSPFPQAGGELGLVGKRLLITAGPCREPIDPVRYISNRSSGKMGFALAQAACAAGADVTLISGPTALTPPTNVAFVAVETTEEMRAAVLERLAGSDALLMAAAPADFTPDQRARQKIKKKSESLAMNLAPTPDILKEVAAQKTAGQIIVGFALETENLQANAAEKLRAKDLDLIIANPATEPGVGFDSDKNRAIALSRDGETVEFPTQSKSALSNEIIALLIKRFAAARTTKST